MTMTPVSCFEITIKRSGPPIERINGGNSEQEAKKAKYRNNAPPVSLLEEVCLKVVDAIRNHKLEVMLNIQDDGTIVSDPTWSPPCSGQPSSKSVATQPAAMMASPMTEGIEDASSKGKGAKKARKK
jgi:hypothetical protein